MGKLMDDSLVSEQTVTLSNIFYDTFAEVVENYKCANMEVWEETCTLVLYDTNAETGLFDKSDIIAVYNKETHLPTIVTERVFRENYTRREWWALKRHLRSKVRVIKQELGFNIRVSYAHNYIDYIHYKEEWWQWALKNTQSH